MRTNREWECGSRYVLKWRESLTISNDPESDEYIPDLLIALPSLVHTMKHVKRIEFEGFPYELQLQLASGFAHSLEELPPNFLNETAANAIAFPKLKELRCSVFDASAGSVHFPKLEFLHTAIIINGSHANAVMPMLKDIMISDEDDQDVDENIIQLKAFLMKNCNTIVHLSVYLPRDGKLDFTNERIVFRKLETVIINDFTFAAKCPALKSLTASAQQSSVAGLPVNQMTTIRVRLRRKGKEFLSRIKRMVNLEQLSLIAFGFEDDVLVDMFDNMTKLEAVFIGVRGKLTANHTNEWHPVLFKNNPNLTSFVIKGDANGKFSL
jgi:hypothetical protein